MAPENEGELSEIIREIEALKSKLHGKKIQNCRKKAQSKE